MDEKLLIKLLHQPREQDWFDFKLKLKLYRSGGDLATNQRDELIKDILGLANGNSRIIRKTKYLIIGASDKEFDETGCRKLYDVNYKIPSQSDIAIWLSNACSPAIVGLETELVLFDSVHLLIIAIPPTFDLHETTRELTGAGHFHKHTVFMRQDEHSVPASVRDGVTIQQLKHLYRQEISNPPAAWIGAIAGGASAYIIGTAGLRAAQTDLSVPENVTQLIFTILGVFFGAATGYIIKTGNETRYDWRYMTGRQRVNLLLFIIAMLVILLIMFR